MKLILVIVAAIAVITMTACSSEKNTAERKLNKPPATVDETTLDRKSVVLGKSVG